MTSRTLGEKRSGALKNQGKVERLDLEKADCLTGRVRGGIVFDEGAVDDAWSACAPSELPESMVLGTASPGWRLHACVPSGLWDPHACGSLRDCGTHACGSPPGVWTPCVWVPLRECGTHACGSLRDCGGHAGVFYDFFGMELSEAGVGIDDGEIGQRFEGKGGVSGVLVS